MDKTIIEIAESLLGRNLYPEDGMDKRLIEKTEIRLDIKLPTPLKEFYTALGNVKMFTSSFEYFVEIEELELTGDKLIFLEENQGVCYWGISLYNQDNRVYMCTDLDKTPLEWYPEVPIDTFLKVVLYLQCAQGGFKYGSAVYESNFTNRKEYEEFLKETTRDWEKVVDHNGFTVFQKEDKLIWYFSDQNGKIENILYTSTRTEDGQKELEKYGFQEL